MLVWAILVDIEATHRGLVILLSLRLRRSHFSICCPLIKIREQIGVGGGTSGVASEPPRLDKNHTWRPLPRPDLSRLVAFGFTRAHKSRRGNIGIPFLFLGRGGRSKRQAHARVSPPCISPSLHLASTCISIAEGTTKISQFLWLASACIFIVKGTTLSSPLICFHFSNQEEGGRFVC